MYQFHLFVPHILYNLHFCCLLGNGHSVVEMSSGSYSRSQDLKGKECLIKLGDISGSNFPGNIGAFIVRVDQIHLFP